LIPRECARNTGARRNLPWALLALAVALPPVRAQAKPAALRAAPFLRARHGAVVSDAEAASRAGAQVLAAGGNAVDAACAATLALGVVHPFASGLGGGGFALVYLAKTGQAVALDFREIAPQALRVGSAGQPPLPRQSGLSVGVPGEPAGLAELVRRFGALPFARCVEPALALARGFPASPFLIRQIHGEIRRNPQTGPRLLAEVFELDGRPPGALRVGDRLARPKLAAALAELRAKGPAGFYQGEVARAMVAAVVSAGGVLTLDDLAHYAPVERTVLTRELLGRRVLLMPPPSSGGTIIAQALGIVSHHLAHKRLAAGSSPPAYLHILAEALKHGFADRARYQGDPGFAAVPLERLLAPAYLRELAGRLRPGAVLPHESYGTPLPLLRPPATPPPDAGTAHVSVVDEAGNAVALTTTVNLEFGARIVGGGIVLNDELDDFTPAPGQSDVFALSGSAANAPAPGKRPVSSMSPTIVLGEHGVELVAGAAGGPRIVSATLGLLLDVMLFGRSARQAVQAPRIHHQWEPDVLCHEPNLPAATVAALAKQGHRTAARGIAKANLIVRSRAGLDAAADPRSGGAAVGF
jgi:gamma-glutamyltranspeptidase/glutathione hydrolase